LTIGETLRTKGEVVHSDSDFVLGVSRCFAEKTRGLRKQVEWVFETAFFGYRHAECVGRELSSKSRPFAGSIKQGSVALLLLLEAAQAVYRHELNEAALFGGS